MRRWIRATFAGICCVLCGCPLPDFQNVDVDETSGEAASSGNDGPCPPSEPSGPCPEDVFCNYDPVWCDCAGPSLNWVCMECPAAQPTPGITCSVETMSCEYGTAPDVQSCVCGDTLQWACGLN